MPDDLLKTVRIANREFEAFMEEVTREGANAMATRPAARRLERVNLRLKQVATHLAEGPGHPKPPLGTEYELFEYRDNLRRLRGTLQTLQFSLLAEKTRLENVRANLQSARAWAASLRDIS